MLSLYHVSYSRPRDGSGGSYVTDALRGKEMLLRRLLLDESGTVMVCGRKSMGRDVRAVLRQLLGKKKTEGPVQLDACSERVQTGAESTNDAIDHLLLGGRFVEELW